MNDFLTCAKGELENVVLLPTLSVSLSHHNKKTGSRSGPRSLSFSACITLWNLMMWIIGILLAMKIFVWIFKMKESKKIKKKMRKKARKMSKS